ncbi:MAG: phosphohydrolase, partial [Desulfuromonas sp.]
TDAEREMIQNHIVATINMLESLPFPKHLRNIPQIAGAHHERLDGKGYPNGLLSEEIPLQGRMLALADIFEALTASDRPYRTPVPLSKALTIMGYMIKEGHLDPELFRLFIDRQLYSGYAEKYLTPEQIDAVDPESIPGYSDA